MNRFIDRKQEMAILEYEYLREESSFVIVYGRRRVGKTALITEFLKQHPADSLYFLATQESEAQNLKAFRRQAADFLNNELLKTAETDWLTIFKLLIQFHPEQRKIIVMDEFQYIGASSKAFPSVMQKIWDTVLKDANVMLILCGSLVTLMKQQTLDYSSPLYGRRTAQIRLKQIPFEYYVDFFSGKMQRDLIPFYAVTGGVPKYIESLRCFSDLREGIAQAILNPQSYLYEEPIFLLQNEVSEIGSYFSLIKAIAMGNHKLSDIAAFIGVKQTSISKYLQVLMDLDLVVREVPVTEKYPEKSKKGLYQISDDFIAFWFRFVYPYRSYLEREEKEYVLHEIDKGFVQNHAAFVYEQLCRETMWHFSAQNIWPFKFDRLGRYWGNLCSETDILAIDSINGNLIIGECKYTQREKGLSILHGLEEKTTLLLDASDCLHVYYVIFSTAGFSQGLIEKAKNSSNLLLVDTFTPLVVNNTTV